MKTDIKGWAFALFALAAATVSGGSGQGKIRAKWFEADITPEIGVKIAGYDTNDVSVAKHDNLFASGLCLDDGSNRVMLVALDLSGMDYPDILEMRRMLAPIVGAKAECIMVSCTHTHEGPHSRSLAADDKAGRAAKSADGGYMPILFQRVASAARDMAAREWGEYKVGYHSSQCHENRNRRYTTADNHASFNAHRPILHKLTTGVVDSEVGTVVLLDKGNAPCYVVGNWAAHPLTAHAPGLGGLRISSDFPGFYRRYIESETGAKAMFVQGAAGDVVTKDDEYGLAAAKRVGEAVAMQSIFGIISISRCQDRFVFANPRVGAVVKSFETRLRKKWREMSGRETQTFDVQALAIGDVCFVGVPGETVNELGLEIKWNSPFARTFVAYCATGYYGYIVPLNLMAAGGYEAHSHRFASRDTLKLVATAQEAMLELRRSLHPEDDDGDAPYPDNLDQPVVNVPGMYKGTIWQK